VTLLPAGWLVDRVGARGGLLLAGVICAGGLAAGAVTTAPFAIYGAAGVAGAGGAFWRVTQAPTLIALAPVGQRSRLFSLNVALIIGAGAVGTAIAGATPGWIERTFAVDPLTALRMGLGLGAACTAVSLGLYVLLRLPATREDPTKASSAGSTTPEPPPLAPASHARMLATVTLVGVWMLGPALVAAFFNLYFFKTFALPVDRIGVIFGLANGGWALAVLLSGEVATRRGLSRMVTAWLFLFGPSVLLPLAGSGAALALFFAQGLAQPAANPLIDQILMERSVPQRRGSVSSWRNVAADASAVAGASLGGWVLAHGSFATLFVIAGLVGVAAAVPLTTALRKLQAS
jgi:MFS family permease